MRKGLFAIMLVAASFAGGAVVNGPGLRWARDMILNQPGSEIATTTLGEAPAEPGDGVAPVEEIPSAPIPPLVVPPAPPEATASAPPSTAPALPDVARADAAPPRPPAPAPPRPKALEPPRSAESRTPEPDEKAPGAAPGVKPPSASVPIAVADATALEPPAPLSTSKDRVPGTTPASPPRPIAAAAPVDPDVSLASLPPDSGPPRLETPPDPSPAPTAGAPASDDWGSIRQKMRALGVARYGIEGEPDGRVRFHCVIPLAGRRAVGQHFEAEGADEIEAAQAALRRVALWRATEHPAPASAPAPVP